MRSQLLTKRLEYRAYLIKSLRRLQAVLDARCKRQKSTKSGNGLCGESLQVLAGGEGDFASDCTVLYFVLCRQNQNRQKLVSKNIPQGKTGSRRLEGCDNEIQGKASGNVHLVVGGRQLDLRLRLVTSQLRVSQPRRLQTRWRKRQPCFSPRKHSRVRPVRQSAHATGSDIGLGR